MLKYIFPMVFIVVLANSILAFLFISRQTAEPSSISTLLLWLLVYLVECATMGVVGYSTGRLFLCFNNECHKKD